MCNAGRGYGARQNMWRRGKNVMGPASACGVMIRHALHGIAFANQRTAFPSEIAIAPPLRPLESLASHVDRCGPHVCGRGSSTLSGHSSPDALVRSPKTPHLLPCGIPAGHKLTQRPTEYYMPPAATVALQRGSKGTLWGGAEGKPGGWRWPVTIAGHAGLTSRDWPRLRRQDAKSSA